MTMTKEPPPRGEPTQRQREVYDWLVDFCETHGYSPTVRELCTAFGLQSTNAAMCHLRPLRKKGFVTWSDRQARTIRPIGGVK